MAGKSFEYTKVLQGLALVGGSDFESWKHLCAKSGNIRKAALEDIDNPLQLIELMERKNLLSENDVSMLVSIMQELGRIEQSNKLVEYEKKWALTKETQTTKYNDLLTKFDHSLNDSEVQQLKFLCRNYPGFTPDKRATMQTSLEIFDHLERAIVLDENETSVLKDLMKQIGRLELAKDVETYEEKYQGKSGLIDAQQEGLEDLREEFDVVVKYIGRNWRQLARRLRVTEADIDCIMVKHPNNLREQSRESLKIWQINNRSAATKAALISALRKCEFNYIADVMEKKITE
ncbi:FAS-associated death domain protein-like [Anneissia japonica]|uniref:FAS-associated death domain protein-like n=1 Tax=Anneissia japonica TaxID=1529436 RepID=UPI00142555D3|nr:FAS-associated death domain protein-like [Anneissia japonica]